MYLNQNVSKCHTMSEPEAMKPCWDGHVWRQKQLDCYQVWDRSLHSLYRTIRAEQYNAKKSLLKASKEKFQCVLDFSVGA